MPGDVLYGRVTYPGQHGTSENKQRRIHWAADATRVGNQAPPKSGTTYSESSMK
jgi:hypothetical protein